jgi:hypothetical protein
LSLFLDKEPNVQDGDAASPDLRTDADPAGRELSNRLRKLTTWVSVVVFSIASFAVLIDQRVHEDLGRLDEASRERHTAMQAARFEEGRLRELRPTFFKELETTRDEHSAAVPTEGEYDTLEAAFADNATLQALPVETLQSRFIDARTVLTRLGYGYRRPRRIFEEYEQHAGTYLAALAREKKATDDARATQDRKESIPSPLGEVNINPSVAFVLLAFITALAYLLLWLETRHLLSLVPRASGASSSLVLAPVWFYTSDERCSRYFGWEATEQRIRFRAALLIHALWLALSIWMMVECFRVGAALRVQFASPASVKMALLLANLIAASLFVHQFFGRRMAPTVEKLRQSVASPITRRTAIATVVIGAVGVAGFKTWRRQQHGAEKRPNITKSADVFAVQQDAPLIENTRTTIVHHRDVCGRHLPADEHRKPASSATWIHRGWEVPILYAIATQIERREMKVRISAPSNAVTRTTPLTLTLPSTSLLSQPSVRRGRTPEREAELAEIRKKESAAMRPAIEMLQRAISLQPLSYHLHDRLVTIYGRLHNFDAIHLLLATAVNQARRELEKHPKSRTAVKAVHALEQRQENARKRAANAAAKRNVIEPVYVSGRLPAA